ncbi:MAG: cell cycle protein [Micromonosporaceae bacterium]|nr:cell cycle protein [Micromonosporaceae bacterium]
MSDRRGIPTASRAVGMLHGLLARPLASYHLLLASAGLLLVIGLTMVFSATSVDAYATDGNAFARIAEQAGYAGIGLVAFWVCQRLPVRTFRALGLPLLLSAFALQGMLNLVDLLNSAGLLETQQLGPLHANLHWLELGGFSVQPSELAKLALVVWAADVLARKGPLVGWSREVVRPLFPVTGLLLLMIGYQDLGTMLCLLVLFIGILWAAGVRIQVFVAMAAVVLGGIALLVVAQSSYRVERLTAFLNPDCDVLDQCYQAAQGRTALADGGWFGAGLGNASLKWGWLPEEDNDFIFAIIGEELGVVGCLVVLTLFGVLAYTGLRIARRVEDRFRRLAAAGVTVWLVGQTVINVGGVVGMLPITGLPLPFISVGGSALVVTLAAVGMLASFARAEPAAARALHARPPARWVRLLWAPLPPRPREPAKQAKRKEAT